MVESGQTIMVNFVGGDERFIRIIRVVRKYIEFQFTTQSKDDTQTHNAYIVSGTTEDDLRIQITNLKF